MTFAASVTIADLPVGTTGTAPKEGSLTTAMLSFGTRSGGPSLNYKNVGQTPALGLRTLTDAAIISSSGSDVKPPRTYSTSYGGGNEPTVALGGDAWGLSVTHHHSDGLWQNT
jgi:hypothetical protein